MLPIIIRHLIIKATEGSLFWQLRVSTKPPLPVL
jgi:hypothetical protein